MKIEDEIKQKEFKTPYIKAILNVVFTANWWNAQSVDSLKPYGISPQQYNILRILRGSHPNKLPVLSIKERMLDRTPNTTRLVDKLLSKGYVFRERCAEDRRVVYIGITEEGLDFMEVLDKDWDSREMFSEINLSDEEANQLSDLLDKLRG